MNTTSESSFYCNFHRTKFIIAQNLSDLDFNYVSSTYYVDFISHVLIYVWSMIIFAKMFFAPFVNCYIFAYSFICLFNYEIKSPVQRLVTKNDQY